MQRKFIDDIKEGDINEIDVFDISGKILLKRGTPVNTFSIEKLKLYNIPFIYIENPHIKINYIYEMNIRAELLKILKCFYESEGENNAILKNYNINEIRIFLSYNNAIGNKIVYGHIFKYFINEMIKCLKKNEDLFYDFLDYRSCENYYFFHAVNVLCISLLLGYKLKLNDEELIDMGIGALLYDLKMLIYKFVEQKRPLDEIEKEEMQQHTYLSFDTIRKIYGISAKSANIAYQHHERIDGSGYPKKLKGDDINIYSKIVAVADVYDALINHRPFRKAYMQDEAWNYIHTNNGILFDSEVVQVFENSIPKYLPGDIVLLNNDKEAVILYNNKEDMERPIIKIIEKKERDDIIFGLGEELNLKENKNINIIKILHSVK